MWFPLRIICIKQVHLLYNIQNVVVHLTYHNFKCCNVYVPIADSLYIQERKLIYRFQNRSYLFQNLIIPIREFYRKYCINLRRLRPVNCTVL